MDLGSVCVGMLFSLPFTQFYLSCVEKRGFKIHK